MTTQTETEKFVQKLNELRMTPEERERAAAEKIGKAIGEIVAGVLILFIAPTIIWSVLVFVVGFNIAWTKVFGIYFIFNFLKNIIIKSFKKK